MKHLTDAQKLLTEGDSVAALGIIEGVLDLAPRNPEALRLKATVLDSWGRFDDSLTTLHHLSQMSGLSDEVMREIGRRAQEEKEAIVYSELTHEGRWYFAFPALQIWISLYGFAGCGIFLLLSPSLLNQGPERFSDLLQAFGFFVVLPWLALMAVHLIGVKRILVGLQGIRVCTRFKEKNYSWDTLGVGVIEYDQDFKTGHLRLLIFSKNDRTAPVLKFDISRKTSVVRARRHFVRNILSYLDTVVFLPRNTDPLSLVSATRSDSDAVSSEAEHVTPAASGNDNGRAA